MAYISYLLIRAALGFLKLLPDSWLYATARGLGILFYRLDRRHREIVEKNLRQAFGSQWNEDQIRFHTKKAFQHFMAVIFESLIAQKRLSREGWARYINFIDADGMNRLLAQNQGLIYLGPHLGNWEILGLSLGLAGFPFQVIARPLKNRYLDDYLRRFRESCGAKTLPRRGGFRDLVGLLKEKGMVGLLPDQNQRKRPIFVSWFGKSAATDRSAAFLAVRFKAPVVVGTTLREGWKFRFITQFQVVQPPMSSGDFDQDILRFSEAIHRTIEAMIQKHPEQYFWLHDRYRTRPAGEKKDAGS